MNSKKATRDCFFFQSLTAPDSLKRLVHTLELIRSLKQLHEWIEHKKYYPVVCLTKNHVFRIFAGRLTDKHPVSIAPVLLYMTYLHNEIVITCKLLQHHDKNTIIADAPFVGGCRCFYGWHVFTMAFWASHYSPTRLFHSEQTR